MFMWPGYNFGGSVKDLEEDEGPLAIDIGYDWDFEHPHNKRAGKGYRLVRPGEKAEPGDECAVTHKINGWDVLDPYYCGLTIQKLWSPIRRKVSTAPAASMWACRHGRDPNTTSCQVCAVLYFRDVTDVLK